MGDQLLGGRICSSRANYFLHHKLLLEKVSSFMIATKRKSQLFPFVRMVANHGSISNTLIVRTETRIANILGRYERDLKDIRNKLCAVSADCSKKKKKKHCLRGYKHPLVRSGHIC